MPRRSVPSFLLTGAFLLAAGPAQAAFHLWEIKEVYSNADGSMQYIELQAFGPGETVVTGAQITAISDASRTFSFPAGNLVGDTSNRHLLIASPGFARLAGAVTADYTLAAGPFFDPEATTITINLTHPSFGLVDSITFAGSTLPFNGRDSLTDTTISTGVTTLVAGQSSPTNYSGAVGALPLDLVFSDGFGSDVLQ